MASRPLLFFFFLAPLSLVYNSAHVNGGNTRGLHTVSIESLHPPSTCSSSTGSNDNMLKVIHRHGPCSPISSQQTINHAQFLGRDQLRVDSINHRISGTSQQPRAGGSLAGVSVPSRLGLSLGNLDYIVTIGFGTPTRDFSVIFDTGSDISWIQCQPCVVQCYPQDEPLFDPSQSSTYTNISCSSTDCSLYGTGCDSSSCLYAVEYGDGSYTAGFFAQETLTLTPNSVLTNFEFGCGEMNSGIFGTVAGLVGLGRSEVSLASQAARKYGEAFSYCLPRTSNSTGYLTLGTGGPSLNAEFTPMLTEPTAPSFYFLELIGISVAGKNLSIPPTVFSDAGTIIDSGTVITRLPSSAYAALRTEFRQQMSNYTLAPPLSILDTCYDFTGVKSIFLPSVALQFSGGAVLDVDPFGILYIANISQACLAFAGNSDATDISIIGNMQQRTYNVVYDIAKEMIGFGPRGCA